MRMNTALTGMSHIDIRLAGGYGMPAARQEPLAHLRRMVLSSMLWEDTFYAPGMELAAQIAELVPKVDPIDVARLAVEARQVQYLRHAPLWLAVCMADHVAHRRLLGDLLPQIIQRADEPTEFLALYWMKGDRPLAKQIKVGLARALTQFDAYQLAKYDRTQDRMVTLRAVFRMVHPKPNDPAQAEVWRRFMHDELPAPDTWEVALSSGQDKRATWERLITTGKLGALAFLRNMIQAGVPDEVIRYGFQTLKFRRIRPTDYYLAWLHRRDLEQEIERAFLSDLAQTLHLGGHTVVVVDLSGSMDASLSNHSFATRRDAAIMLAMAVQAASERCTIYFTAGSDIARQHKTAQVSGTGFALFDLAKRYSRELGGGGIFTRQALEWISQHLAADDTVDRIVVITDSQDTDNVPRPPRPFGRYNYLADVGSYKYGINYAGIWTAEITGFSPMLVHYIAALES